MKILSFKSYKDLSRKAATTVLDEIRSKPDLLLCAATGSSPRGMYAILSSEFQKYSSMTQQIKIIKLDEWVGVPSHSEASCEGYLQEHLVKPLHISEDRYFAFNAMANDLDAECIRMQNLLKKHGPIDLCILGLGKNGHLGFNEPGDTLKAHCHSVILSEVSLTHDMIGSINEKPTHGITLGMSDILSSRKILLIISGEGKEDAKKAFFSQRITNAYPATHLWKHAHVDCLVLE